MAQEKLENLSTEKLLKRSKFIYLMVGIMIGLIIVYAALLIYMLVDEDKEFVAAAFAPLFAFLGTMLPLGIGLKNIRQELKRRGIDKIR